MSRPQVISAKIALAFLVVFELVTLYQVLFDAWMTAYPFSNHREWEIRFYLRLATAVVVGLLWISIAVWLYRERKRDRPEISN